MLLFAAGPLRFLSQQNAQHHFQDLKRIIFQRANQLSLPRRILRGRLISRPVVNGVWVHAERESRKVEKRAPSWLRKSHRSYSLLKR